MVTAVVVLILLALPRRPYRTYTQLVDSCPTPAADTAAADTAVVVTAAVTAAWKVARTMR